MGCVMRGVAHYGWHSMRIVSRVSSAINRSGGDDISTTTIFTCVVPALQFILSLR